MIREQIERALASVQRGEWLGSVADVVQKDLADEAHLPDLVDTDDADTIAFLRDSRIPRIRPILVVLAARAAGGAEVDPELQYAAELLYGALSVHDVALGNPGGKRRKLAKHVLRGMGWLGANRILLRAMELARHAPNTEVLDDLLDTLRAFGDGQDVARTLVDEGIPTHELWQEHADGHTGALFAFCCRAGANVGGSTPGELASFGRFGRHLGRMWHIAEDVILLQGEEAAEFLVGRALLGRPMLPVAVAADRDPGVAALWRRTVVDHDADAASELLERIHATNAVRGCREMMAQEHWAARQALMRFEDTAYRHALERLASGLSRAPFEDRDPGPSIYRGG